MVTQVFVLECESIAGERQRAEENKGQLIRAMDRLAIHSSSSYSVSPFRQRSHALSHALFAPIFLHRGAHGARLNVKKPLPLHCFLGGLGEGKGLRGGWSFSNPQNPPNPHHTVQSAAKTPPLKHKHKEKDAAWFRKLANSAGTIVLLSALIVVYIHPTLAAFALAGAKPAAKAGNTAAISVGGKASGTFFQSEVLSSAWTGFVAGCLHTLSGPDHLAALAPLSIGRTKMESAAVGALWGCGHDAGQVIFGILFLLLKEKLHIEIIRTWGTRVVGVTLLVIGAMGIKEASETPTPCVAINGDECEVDILESAQVLTGAKRKVGFATFATGIVHGLQPDALMMILPALALPSRLAGAAFLCTFLFGTVLAMGSYTVFIGSCSEALKTRVPRITEKLTWASSLIAITLGLAILFSQLFGFSLF